MASETPTIVQIIDKTTDKFGNSLEKLEDTNISIAAVHENEIEALDFAHKNNPSIILLDYNLRGIQTPEYIRYLLKGASTTSKIILLARQLPDEMVIDCLVSGAQGFMEVDSINQFIIKAIQVVDDGEAWISRRMVGLLLDRIRQEITLANDSGIDWY